MDLLGFHIVMHYQRQSSFLLCFHMIINNLLLFMSMSNLILININITDKVNLSFHIHVGG
jgi:hypothetical protein